MIEFLLLITVFAWIGHRMQRRTMPLVVVVVPVTVEVQIPALENDFTQWELEAME